MDAMTDTPNDNPVVLENGFVVDKTMGSNNTKNVILQTYDYSMFKTLETNRNLDVSHVSKLSKSVTFIGTNVNAITVTEDFFVIDGQQRLAACEKAGVMVSYVIRNFPEHMTNKDLMLELNISSKNWTTTDYVVSNNKAGIGGYSELVHLMDVYDVRYGLLVDLGIAPSYAAPKKGTPLVIDLPESILVLTNYFRLLNEFRLLWTRAELANTQRLARAYRNVLKAKDKYEKVEKFYDIDKIIRSLKSIKKHWTYPPASEPEFRAILADAMDYYTPNKNKIGEEIRSISDKLD